jgi:hypothetical protein
MINRSVLKLITGLSWFLMYLYRPGGKAVIMKPKTHTGHAVNSLRYAGLLKISLLQNKTGDKTGDSLKKRGAKSLFFNCFKKIKKGWNASTARLSSLLIKVYAFLLSCRSWVRIPPGPLKLKCKHSKHFSFFYALTSAALKIKRGTKEGTKHPFFVPPSRKSCPLVAQVAIPATSHFVTLYHIQKAIIKFIFDFVLQYQNKGYLCFSSVQNLIQQI